MFYHGNKVAFLTSHTIEVSELNRLVKQILHTELGTVQIVGELSNTSRASSGHYYFTLKDANAQVSCAMFRSATPNFKLEDGQMVMAQAKVSLYEPRGQFQLIVDNISLHGTGQLQKAFEALKKKLLQEGLFDESKKQPLPARPETIGIVTSPQAAALMDVEKVLSKRYPIARRILYPAQVQGEASAQTLINALKKAINHNIADVILLVRGGGSMEDLWSFNDESLARTIASSPIPVVTGVGHQTDTTIVDFVADQACPTPSAAAACVSPDIIELIERTQQLKKSLQNSLLNLWENKSLYLDQWQHRLISPQEMIRQQKIQLSHTLQQLHHLHSAGLTQQYHKIKIMQHRIDQYSPVGDILRSMQTINQLRQRLQSVSVQHIHNLKQTLSAMSQTIDLLNPENVLDRGYAVITNDKNDVIQNSQNLKPHDLVNIRWHKNKAKAEIKSIN